MSLLSTKHTKSSRKTKKCAWCNESIEIGQPKVSSTEVFDGDVVTSHYHPECIEAQNKWSAANGYDDLPEFPMERGQIEMKCQ